jgi:hypothetical protein
MLLDGSIIDYCYILFLHYLKFSAIYWNRPASLSPLELFIMLSMVFDDFSVIEERKEEERRE